MKVTMCDPPSGWMFGFPKVIPEDRKNDVIEWLVEQGYPRAEITALREFFYCRFWEEEQ